MLIVIFGALNASATLLLWKTVQKINNNTENSQKYHKHVTGPLLINIKSCMPKANQFSQVLDRPSRVTRSGWFLQEQYRWTVIIFWEILSQGSCAQTYVLFASLCGVLACSTHACNEVLWVIILWVLRVMIVCVRESIACHKCVYESMVWFSR
jgi:hypothetical protein